MEREQQTGKQRIKDASLPASGACGRYLPQIISPPLAVHYTEWQSQRAYGWAYQEGLRFCWQIKKLQQKTNKII